MNWPQKPWGETTDAITPSLAQQQKLSAMLATALTEIRALGRDGKHGQATALADAFHNLPIVMWTAHFSPKQFRQTLEDYHQSFPGSGYFDYVQQLREVEATF